MTWSTSPPFMSLEMTSLSMFEGIPIMYPSSDKNIALFQRINGDNHVESSVKRRNSNMLKGLVPRGLLSCEIFHSASTTRMSFLLRYLANITDTSSLKLGIAREGSVS